MKFLISFLILFATVLPQETELFKAIQQDPYLSAGNLHPYIAPQEKKMDTKAPRGYKPFYFSYYGRHGSRYLTGSVTAISKYTDILKEMQKKDALTQDGEKLLEWMQWLENEHYGNSGSLTELGFKEAQGISKRIYKRYRRVFRQCKRRQVIVRSSPSMRSAMTGTSFIMELRRNSPRLEFDVKAGEKYYFTHWDENPGLDETEFRVLDSMIREQIDTVAFCKKFFTSEDAFAEALGDISIGRAQYYIIHYLSVARCISPDADPLEVFSEREIFDYAVVQNARTASWFIHSKETGAYRDTNAGAPLLNELVGRADEAIAGNDICANLRFGHDSGVGPMFSFLYSDGYDQNVSLAETYRTWPVYQHLTMGANFSMILYKNRKGDVLVKILENERETTIPAISPVKGPYYRWEDFKNWATRKI